MKLEVFYRCTNSLDFAVLMIGSSASFCMKTELFRDTSTVFDTQAESLYVEKNYLPSII